MRSNCRKEVRDETGRLPSERGDCYKRKSRVKGRGRDDAVDCDGGAGMSVHVSLVVLWCLQDGREDEEEGVVPPSTLIGRAAGSRRNGEGGRGSGAC